jgi:FixJ family two-component response regulator
MFATAEEFLSAPPETEPIGLLLDVHLTGMSGLDLQRHLNAQGSTVPIIVITGHDDPRAEEQATRAGCLAYLRKPCEAGVILSVLESITGRSAER